MSTTRIRNLSAKPSRQPEKRPSITPMTSAVGMVVATTISERRAPWIHPA